MTPSGTGTPASAIDPGPGDLHRGPERPRRRLVLLHGWGADADDLLDLGTALVAGLPGDSAGVVALRAPLPHPGGVGRQWYDLQPPEWPQVPAALRDLRRRLEELASTVPFERTALLGFSQGAAMALDVATGGGSGGATGDAAGDAEDDCGTREALPLAGLIACSGYPHPAWSPHDVRTRILLTHGGQDAVVPHQACLELEQRLVRAGGEVERISFPGGHGIDPGLLPRLRAFLQACWSET